MTAVSRTGRSGLLHFAPGASPEGLLSCPVFEETTLKRRPAKSREFHTGVLVLVVILTLTVPAPRLFLKTDLTFSVFVSFFYDLSIGRFMLPLPSPENVTASCFGRQGPV